MNVTCENLQDTFEYAIISHKTMLNGDYGYKKATGTWVDSFTLDSGFPMYEKWYLMLQSDNNTKCTVKLNIRPLNPIENPTSNNEVPKFKILFGKAENSTSLTPDDPPSETLIEERDACEEEEQDFFKWVATRPSGCTIYYKCNFNNTTR